MEKRIQLHNILVEILGSNNVYFQPPENISINYPCIIYTRSSRSTIYADNNPYNINRKRYTITIIDSNPDSPIPDKIAALPMCKFDRHFKANNLNHDVYNIYF